MTPTQIKFLDNLTPAQAEAVIAKFRSDPRVAANASDAAYVAFTQAWELLNPTEYWQRHSFAGGVNYRLISLV